MGAARRDLGTSVAAAVSADSDPDAGEWSRAGCARHGVQALFVPTDVAHPQGVERLVEAAARLGPADVVSTGAGLA